MDFFQYKNGELYAEGVSVEDIANEFGTPTYVYSRKTLERHWRVFHEALGNHPHEICYAVKANSNIAVLNVLARLGSGFDIVSGGELKRVLAAGGNPQKIVFSGVAKTAEEIALGLETGIHCFNIECEDELHRINAIAKEKNKQASIAFRINPHVSLDTHPYVATGMKDNKFGIDQEKALEVYREAKSLTHVKSVGISCHIGSQLLTLDPFLEALHALLALVDKLKAEDIFLEHLDLGGGLGVRYQEEMPPEPKHYGEAILKVIGNRPLKIFLEPGRAIAANAGILVTTVNYLKHTPYKHFALVDAGMNDLLRPSLYGAWQDIIPVKPRTNKAPLKFDVVGPVCESGDFLGKERELSLEDKDRLVVRTAGAYGFTMSSNYNTRPKSAEIMVDGDKVYVIRPRETVEELFASETLLP